MYENLKAEMVRHKLNDEDIAEAINKSTRTVRRKLSGAAPFTFNESVAIRKTFFPGVRLEYLFDETD